MKGIGQLLLSRCAGGSVILRSTCCVFGDAYLQSALLEALRDTVHDQSLDPAWVSLLLAMPPEAELTTKLFASYVLWRGVPSLPPRRRLPLLVAAVLSCHCIARACACACACACVCACACPAVVAHTRQLSRCRAWRCGLQLPPSCTMTSLVATTACLPPSTPHLSRCPPKQRQIVRCGEWAVQWYCYGAIAVTHHRDRCRFNTGTMDAGCVVCAATAS